MTAPNFKELLAVDNNVFFHEGEFAEMHTVDGKDIVILIDREELQKRKASSSNPEDGIHAVELLFFASKSDFPKRPVVDRMMRIGTRLYRLADVQDDDPYMYTVLLERAGS